MQRKIVHAQKLQNGGPKGPMFKDGRAWEYGQRNALLLGSVVRWLLRA